MDPIHNGYKTQVIGAGSGKADVVPTGKADILPTDDAAGSGTGDAYYDGIMKLGADKMGKKQEAPAASSDAMGDLLNTLDQANNQGVPNSGPIPLALIPLEGLMASNPDFSPQDILTKYNSILNLVDNKIKQIDAALANGGGTPQQIKAAQAMKAQLQNYHNFYLPQRDKAAALVPQYNAQCEKELKNAQQTGGLVSADTLDWNHDGWVGIPNGPDSYQVASYVWDKAGTDPLAKQMVDTAKAAGKKVDIKSDFKKGDIEYWLVNPTTQKRIQFNPITGAIANEQVPAPDYVTDLGAGFGGGDQTEVVPKTDGPNKGEIVLQTGKTTSSKLYAEAGLELHEAEYVWVKANADKTPELNDDGSYKPVSFGLKDGKLVQNKPPDDGSNCVQIYVKKMDVSSEKGDIVVQLRGGETNAKILTLRVQAPPNSGKATDTALAITDNGRGTPIKVDAGAYQSTCRQGIKNTQFFTDLFKKSGVTSPNLSDPAIQDTLQNFEAGDSGQIKGLLNRGIAFKGSGSYIGTNDNDLFEIETPPANLKPSDDGKDGAYASVVIGGAGHNALWGTTGSLYANGMTLVSKDSGTAKDRVFIGTNTFGEQKSKYGGVESTKGSNDPNAKSNKLFIRVHALQSDAVAIESIPDQIVSAAKNPSDKDPIGWEGGDDHYDIQAKQVATTSYDATTNQSLDPDMQNGINGTNPVQGILTSASIGDFQAGGKFFSDANQSLEDSINKKASANVDLNWTIPGATLDWTKGKYYQGDKTTLDSFFADFTGSKMDSYDPFAKEAKGEDVAKGGK